MDEESKSNKNDEVYNFYRIYGKLSTKNYENYSFKFMKLEKLIQNTFVKIGYHCFVNQFIFI